MREKLSRRYVRLNNETFSRLQGQAYLPIVDVLAVRVERSAAKSKHKVLNNHALECPSTSQLLRVVCPDRVEGLIMTENTFKSISYIVVSFCCVKVGCPPFQDTLHYFRTTVAFVRVRNHLVVPAQAGTQFVPPCKASEFSSCGSGYELVSSWSLPSNVLIGGWNDGAAVAASHDLKAMTLQ
jgi:hypothetical protein